PAVGEGERQRYRAVLLDVYPDTGHAQRVMLRALFRTRDDEPPLAVTAVGDPCQSIYGWRGASAANLPRFGTDFPVLRAAPGGPRWLPARQYGLLTSFRNPPEVLTLANAVSEPLRGGGGPDDGAGGDGGGGGGDGGGGDGGDSGGRDSGGDDGGSPAGVTGVPGRGGQVRVGELRPRPGADPGTVRVALLPDLTTELEWVADALAARWHARVDAGSEPPTAAVLVRRRADMAPLAAALRARDLPVEVVGLGGLLAEPEVRDLVSALRLVADPLAGTAAVRLLTGARWRLGVADLAALWRRAKELARPLAER